MPYYNNRFKSLIVYLFSQIKSIDSREGYISQENVKMVYKLILVVNYLLWYNEIITQRGVRGMEYKDREMSVDKIKREYRIRVTQADNVGILHVKAATVGEALLTARDLTSQWAELLII